MCYTVLHGFARSPIVDICLPARGSTPITNLAKGCGSVPLQSVKYSHLCNIVNCDIHQNVKMFSSRLHCPKYSRQVCFPCSRPAKLLSHAMQQPISQKFVVKPVFFLSTSILIIMSLHRKTHARSILPFAPDLPTRISTHRVL